MSTTAMTSLFAAQLYPQQALGFFVIGASLHDILTRIKAEPYRFPMLDLIYSPTNPLLEPVAIDLPENGLRLRFDGPEQRLRLVEVLDFSKNLITIKKDNIEKTLVKAREDTGATARTDPTYKHICYSFLGLPFPGEYIPNDDGSNGVYVVSFPGVAFTFPVSDPVAAQRKDYEPPGHTVASSMAVYGEHNSWSEARQFLWTEELPSLKTFAPLAKTKDVFPDEVSLVKIHGGGRLQLFRKWTSNSTWIQLGETTPQDLVAELGPPDAIYRKNDQRMYIHKIRTTSNSRTRPGSRDMGRSEPLTDTDQSSAHTVSDDSTDEAAEDVNAGGLSSECFYNYFYLGFDILITTPAPHSQLPHTSNNESSESESHLKTAAADSLVATKLVLHGNIPGSYPFNRHRRCRWELAYTKDPINSEAIFVDIEHSLQQHWKLDTSSEAQRQRGMVLNRGWGESPGSSCEFLGGWEESASDVRDKNGGEDSTTTLYGFPGLVFEVLKNGCVSAVTVF